jgi:hypothetical protein
VKEFEQLTRFAVSRAENRGQRMGMAPSTNTSFAEHRPNCVAALRGHAERAHFAGDTLDGACAEPKLAGYFQNALAGPQFNRGAFINGQNIG